MGCTCSKAFLSSNASSDHQAPACAVIRDASAAEQPIKAEAQASQATNSGSCITALLDSMFNQLDKNGDGFVSKYELSNRLNEVLGHRELDSEKSVKNKIAEFESKKSFRTLIAESGLNPYLHLFDNLDTNRDGKISREEFHANLHPAKAAVHVERHLKAFFLRLDTNGDGCLSREELAFSFGYLMERRDLTSGKSMRTLLVDAGLNPDFNVFDQLDANRDGKITWDEFCSGLRQVNIDDIKEFLKRAFASMDTNGDGSVSRTELSESIENLLDCSHLQSKKTLRTLIKDVGLNPDFYFFEQLDTNEDGKITWEEFEKALGIS